MSPESWVSVGKLNQLYTNWFLEDGGEQKCLLLGNGRP